MLKVGITGCGEIYEHHRRGWSGVGGFELTGFFDENPETARAISQRTRGATAFESLEDLVAACDVVDVCTPPASHYAIAMAAIEAGCHLLIEKPVTLRRAEWDDIARFALERGVKVGALHNQKFFGVNLRAKRWLAENRIGRLLRVHDEYMVTPRNEWMLGADGHWSHDLPGGRWLETLPHNLYLLHGFAGPMELAGASVCGGPDSPPGARAAEVVITLASETALATIHFSASCELDRRAMTLVGSEGVIRVVPSGRAATLSRFHASPLNKAVGLPFLDAAAALLRMVPDRAQFYAGLLGRDAHGENIARFGSYVTGRGENPTPWEEIAYTVRLTESIGAAIEAGLRDPGGRPAERVPVGV